jgi:Ni,Fe-hydrogenase III small subunit
LEGSLPEDGKEKGQKEADDDAGHEGEIEGELVPLDINIPGEPADPRDLVA